MREPQAEAASVLRECCAALATQGRTVIDEAIGAAPGVAARDIAAHDIAAPDIVDWRHYPDGEAYDPETHVQYFYHRHADPDPSGAGRPHKTDEHEHGHFHLFLRGEGIPAGITPLLLPELAVAGAPVRPSSAPLKRGGRDEVCHLVAVSIDRHGEPFRLFTTNRWVTGETWYRAEDAIRLLDRFVLRTDQPSAVLNRWLVALVRLYGTEIADLLKDRDKKIVDQRWRGRSNILEDPRLDVTSAVSINLGARLAADLQSREAATAAGARRPRSLPRMAEGWGA